MKIPATKEKKHRLGFWVTPEEFTMLKELRIENNTSVSALIRHLIVQTHKKRK